MLLEVKTIDQLLEDISLPIDQLLLERLEQVCKPRDDNLLGPCLNNNKAIRTIMSYCSMRVFKLFLQLVKDILEVTLLIDHCPQHEVQQRLINSRYDLVCVGLISRRIH